MDPKCHPPSIGPLAGPPHRAGVTTAIAAGIFLLSLAPRAWLVVKTDPVDLEYFYGITSIFRTWAIAVAGGDLFPGGVSYMPLTAWIHGAMVWLLGTENGILCGRLLQAGLDSLASVGLFFLGSSLCGRGAGIVAALVHATAWEFIGSCVHLLPEATSVFWLTAVLWFFQQGFFQRGAFQRGTFQRGLAAPGSWRKNWLLCGLFLAGGYYARCELLILPVFLVGIAALTQTAWTLRERLTRPLLIPAVFVPFLLPWLFHTRSVTGEFLPTTVGSGQTTWEGLGETINPYGFVLDDAYMGHYLKAKGFGYFTVEGNRHLRSEVMEFAPSHPAYIAQLFYLRTTQALFQQLQYAQALEPRVLGRLPWSSKGMLSLLLVLGLALFFFEPRRMLLVFLPLVYYCLLYGLVHYESRYLVPAHLTYCLLWGRLAALALPALSASAAFLWKWCRKERPLSAPFGDPVLRRRVLRFLTIAAVLAIGLGGARRGIRAFAAFERDRFLKFVGRGGALQPILRRDGAIDLEIGREIVIPLEGHKPIEPYILVVTGKIQTGRILIRLVLGDGDVRDLMRLDGESGTKCLLYSFGAGPSTMPIRVHLVGEAFPKVRPEAARGVLDLRIVPANEVPMHYALLKNYELIQLEDE